MPKPSAVSFPLALSLHLLRGLVGVSALIAAFWAINSHVPAAAFIAAGLVVLALISWRGCPTCWLMGLCGVLGSRQPPSGDA